MKIKKTLPILIATQLAVCLVDQSYAANINAITSSNVKSQNVAGLSVAEKAKMWGLTRDEYKQYLYEMKTTPAGVWWKKLDPPQVLGQDAKSEQERIKYAKIDVQLDHQKAMREIAFQHAYEKAFSDLYPNAKLINIDTETSQHNSVVKSDDQYFLFTSINDPEGSLLIDKLISQEQGKNHIAINVFFVGHASFDQIQQWGRNNNIPMKMKDGNKVTLNHNMTNGVNKLKSVFGNKQAALPVLIRVRHGESEKLSAMSL